MKKLLIVFTAILMVAFAAPVFASDTTWGGEFDFGGITAFDKLDVDAYYANLYLDGSFAVDDYNTVLLEFKSDVVDGVGGNWKVNAANLESDIGEAAGLPVGLKIRGGLSGVYSNKYEVTGHGFERVLFTPPGEKARPNIEGSGIFGIVDAEIATIDVGVTFETGPDAQDYALMVTIPEFGPVAAQVGYYVAGADDFMGVLGLNVKALGIAEKIDVAGGFAYDLAAAGAPKWYLGAGVKANVSMFGIGVGIKGMEEAPVDVLTVDVNVGVTDEFGIDVGVGLGLDDDKDIFGGLEPSIYYKVGASTWRLGYLLASSFGTAAGEWSYSYLAPTSAPIDGSGLFLACGIDF